MIRVILFLIAVLAVATGLSWLADRPGNVRVEWEGSVLDVSLFHAVVITTLLVGVSLVAWSILRQLWHSPAALGNLMNRRRTKRGLEALSAGMIAVGSGDRANAMKYAIAARKTLPNEPMTHLLRAQAAQLAGDKSTSRRIFEAMLGSPETEPLGLRGLFLEAQREKETEAARHFAARALKLNSKLTWASDALFDLQCKTGDWAAALETLAQARKNGLVEKAVADRRRAVLLTAKAIAAEDSEPEKALNLAIEAHNLAPDLVPAATQAGRMLASRGNTPKAAKVLERTWSRSPHPDLATVYAYARIGDSPRDRLARVKRLAEMNPHTIESAIAVANAAIDARAFDEARAALAPMLAERLTQRIATLMARIESEQHGDRGRVREWLARAVNAPRDPVWTADGIVADDWAPISPVTGLLDAYQWKVPVETLAPRDSDVVTRRIEELVALGAPSPQRQPLDDDAITLEPETVAAPARGPAAAEPRRDQVKSAATATETKPPTTPVTGAPAKAVVVQSEAPKPSPAKVEVAKAEPVTAVAAAPEQAKSTEPVKMPAAIKAAEPVRDAAASTTAPAKAPAAPAKIEVVAGTAVAPQKPAGKIEPETPATVGPVKPAAEIVTKPVDVARISGADNAVTPKAAAPASAATQTAAAVSSATSAIGQAAAGAAKSAGAMATTAATSATAAANSATAAVSAATGAGASAASAAPAAAAAPSASVASPSASSPSQAAGYLAKSATPATETAVGKDVAAVKSTPAATGDRDAGTKDQPRIFVVPHAPDDPGPDGSDDPTPPAKGARPPYRAIT
jgi:HemY protein